MPPSIKAVVPLTILVAFVAFVFLKTRTTESPAKRAPQELSGGDSFEPKTNQSPEEGGAISGKPKDVTTTPAKDLRLEYLADGRTLM